MEVFLQPTTASSPKFLGQGRDMAFYFCRASFISCGWKFRHGVQTGSLLVWGKRVVGVGRDIFRAGTVSGKPRACSRSLAVEGNFQVQMLLRLLREVCSKHLDKASGQTRFQ